MLLSSAKNRKNGAPSNSEEQEKRFESFGDVEMKQNISLLSSKVLSLVLVRLQRTFLIPCFNGALHHEFGASLIRLS